MALQYDTPVTTDEFTAALAANASISAATTAAISSLLGLDTADTVTVAAWDGISADVTAPEGVVADVVSIAVAGTDAVTLDLPASVADAPVIIIQSDADVTLTVGQEAAADANARVAAVALDERVVVGGNGDDNLTVLGSTNVTLDGGDGNDTLVTGSGNDTITAGAGNDTIDAGAGNDTIIVGQGRDVVVAGSGYDALQVTGLSTDFDVTTAGGLLVLNGTDTGASAAASITAQGAEFVTFSDGETLAVASTEEQAAALRLYEGVLGRDADQGGAEAFSAAADAGASLTTLTESFLSSAEYQNGLNTDFVADAYLDFLGRPVDDGGEAAFLNLLANGGTRADVITSLVNSAEGQEVPLGNTAFINALYENALGHDASTDDTAGLANWITALNGGVSREDVTAQIFNSVEANQKVATDFVDSLYENALGKGVNDDLAGKASWTNALENGVSQADVAIGIIGSPEGVEHNTNVIVVHGAV
jgi:hypothetical protein